MLLNNNYSIRNTTLLLLHNPAHPCVRQFYQRPYAPPAQPPCLGHLRPAANPAVARRGPSSRAPSQETPPCRLTLLPCEHRSPPSRPPALLLPHLPLHGAELTDSPAAASASMALPVRRELTAQRYVMGNAREIYSTVLVLFEPLRWLQCHQRIRSIHQGAARSPPIPNSERLIKTHGIMEYEIENRR